MQHNITEKCFTQLSWGRKRRVWGPWGWEVGKLVMNVVMDLLTWDTIIKVLQNNRTSTNFKSYIHTKDTQKVNTHMKICPILVITNQKQNEIAFHIHNDSIIGILKEKIKRQG